MKKTICSWGIVLSLILLAGLSSCSKDEDDKDNNGGGDDVKVDSVMSLAIPAFKDSYVYVAKDGTVKVAEVCNEYIPAFSKEKRATVVYPCDKTGKVDYLKGFVVDNGGSVAWEDGVCTYDAGSRTALATVYIDGNKVVASGQSLKTLKVEADLVKDAEGNSYGVVKVGMQHWLRENFKSTKYNDGKAIKANVLFEDWGSETEGLYGTYVVPEGDLPEVIGTPEIAKQNFGLLYNWTAAHEKLAPAGWHLPSNKEWAAMRTYLGDNEKMNDEAVAGGLLQKVDDKLWAKPSCATPNYVASDITGFSAVGGGRMQFGICTGLKEGASWWAVDVDPDSEDYGETYAFYWDVNNVRATLFGGMRYNQNPDTGEEFYTAQSLSGGGCACSVRFIKD